MKWVNERRIPEELRNLLQEPNLPEELQASILQAIDEVEQRGAVTYTTKARVEYHLHLLEHEEAEEQGSGRSDDTAK